MAPLDCRYVPLNMFKCVWGQSAMLYGKSLKRHPNFRSLDEVVLIPGPPPDTGFNNPVIWNENVCKLFVKEKTPSPHLALKFGTNKLRRRAPQANSNSPSDHPSVFHSIEEVDLSPQKIDHSCSCQKSSHESEVLKGKSNFDTLF